MLCLRSAAAIAIDSNSHFSIKIEQFQRYRLDTSLLSSSASPKPHHTHYA
jgi:hypothetical protein